MSFTTKVYDADTKALLTTIDEIDSHSTYAMCTCDMDGSRVYVTRTGQAWCAKGHRWLEVETLASDGRTRLNEGGSWRLVDGPGIR